MTKFFDNERSIKNKKKKKNNINNKFNFWFEKKIFWKKKGKVKRSKEKKKMLLTRVKIETMQDEVEVTRRGDGIQAESHGESKSVEVWEAMGYGAGGGISTKYSS